MERGESVETPPVLYLQGTKDVAHPRPDLDRFVAAYRQRGGQVELELYEGEAEGFVNRNPNSPGAAQAVARIVEFVGKQLG
jgi:acetyl esterase/lipase